ncbi:MAG TPA: hypothetical protein VFV05_22260 [Methylomirabilota bacterium]|nr:hypothetical protein [Methylomirabilota bacterium]
MPPLLFVVSRRQPDLYEYLVQQFGDEPEVTVLLDRRLAERRRTVAPRPSDAERRQADRRRNNDAAYELLTMGYTSVRTAPDRPNGRGPR